MSAYRCSNAEKAILQVFDYDDVWNNILFEQPFEKDMINGAMVAWDNTARNRNGIVIKGATPEKFEHYMKILLEKESAMDMVVINAWNEWAEGAYLEADEKYGYGFLEALQRAMMSKGF